VTVKAGAADKCKQDSCACLDEGKDLLEDLSTDRLSEQFDHFICMKLLFLHGPIWIFFSFIDLFAASHRMPTMALR
jgi:hypothetical protein